MDSLQIRDLSSQLLNDGLDVFKVPAGLEEQVCPESHPSWLFLYAQCLQLRRQDRLKNSCPAALPSHSHHRLQYPHTAVSWRPIPATVLQ